MLGAATAQWSPTAFKGEKVRKEADMKAYYSLDISALRSQLANAQESGRGAKAVEISLPTLGGKVEKFAIYSFPVFAKDIADQYQLGSYVGVGIDDPSKYVRFSLSPNDFQSMIITNGQYEFVEPVNSDKTIYGVHPKTQGDKNGFVCSTSESPAALEQIDLLKEKGKSFTNQPTDFAKSYDKKYRTMRLAISATSSYVNFTGGTLATALAQINATMTRVNGVFEKDFALHLNIANYPGIIYTNAATDPYAGVTNLNLKLQQILTADVGNANYDIGHVFNAAGNNGNAGCIGCVCIAPASNNALGKGSAFTQSTSPAGDTFDIDFVAHEMGHQLGGNHTFAHSLEGSGTNMEPGSGSTIMGYAGITGPNTDVQPNSDPYFHVVSLDQINSNLIAKTCDVETPIANNPPVISPLPAYTIPKGTAFVLTASVTDPENDPMTFTWEQFDNASVIINKSNIGTTTTGAAFRSVAPSTVPTRYFPKLESVLNGYLDNSNNTWESVPMVARAMNFVITARDNNSNITQQQADYALQNITVGNDGPFRVTTLFANVNTPTPINWDVANTAAAPYNVVNVKIDYTTNNGTSWTTLIASTPNDGTENFTFPSTLNGQIIKLRVSSINNVFYAVGRITVTAFAPCDGSAVTGVTTSNITYNSVVVSWTPVSNATYIIRYRPVGSSTWQQTTSTVPTVTISGLTGPTAYEAQVSAVCSGTPGTYSASVNFSTPAVTYCTISANNATQYEYISNVKITNGTTTLLNNSSGPSNYSNYTTNTALQPNLILGTSYTFSMTITDADYDTALVFIDYNNNGTFESTERVFNYPINLPTGPISGNFTIPASAVTNQPLRMRVILYYAGQFSSTGSSQVGFSLNSSYTGCGTYGFGEAEDYNVILSSTALATSDLATPKDGIQIYPNPVSDILNITKVSDKATYKIYSAAGQLTRHGNISNGQINVSELVKGAYILTIEEKGKESFTSKFIKK